jgi:glutathione S-transferase
MIQVSLKKRGRYFQLNLKSIYQKELIMLTLFGSGQSRSFRALWAIEESGLPFDYKAVNIGQSGEDGTQADAYKQLNFQGKVPSLVDGELIVNESAAILNYIAACVPEKQLIPIDDIALRAYYDEVSFFVLSELEQSLWTYGKHTFVLPKEHRVKAVLDTAHWEFEKSLKALTQYVADNEFVVGEQFSMADILVAQTLNWAQRSKFSVPEDLRNYKENLYQRPACQRALERVL